MASMEPARIVAVVLFKDYDAEYAGGSVDEFMPLAEQIIDALEHGGYPLPPYQPERDEV